MSNELNTALLVAAFVLIGAIVKYDRQLRRWFLGGRKHRRRAKR